MECITPAIDGIVSKDLDPENGLNLNYGFIMDNVQSVRQLSSRNMQHFQLFPNPIYYKFDKDHIKQYKSDYLTINGANLDRASQELDVVVRIGSEFCNVTSLSRSQLTCRPPPEQPAPLHSSHTLPQVVVSIGDRLEYQIGFLEYSGLSDGGTLSKKVITMLIVGAGVLIIILVVCLIVYRRKSYQNSRVLKSMQDQMDVLELRVAAECKEGKILYMGRLNYYVGQCCAIK